MESIEKMENCAHQTIENVPDLMESENVAELNDQKSENNNKMETDSEVVDDIKKIDSVTEQICEEAKVDVVNSDLAKISMKINPSPEVQSSLGMLAQYGSSSDEDDDKNDKKKHVKYLNKEKHREVNISSEDSSSSSDSDSDNDTKKMDDAKFRAHMNRVMDLVHSDDDEDGTNKHIKKKDPLRVKGELLLEDLPPIEDLQISVTEQECVELGIISSIVDQLVLVQAYTNSIPLDIDTVLFLDVGKKTLGKIFDVIGQIHQPLYCIRFNSSDEIITKGITINMKVYCAPHTEYTSFVILSNVMMKGSDASWKDDIEPPEHLVDYSDDECERNQRRRKKKMQQQNGNTENQSNIRPTYNNPNQQPHSWHKNLNQYKRN